MAIESITLKNGQKRYKARIWDPVLKRRVSRTFTRKKDAEQALADMRMRIYMGESLERRQDIMFVTLADEVLENCTAGESTVAEYRRINAQLSELIGKKSVRAITARDIEKVVAELSRRYAPNTVQKAIVRLRHILKRAVAYGYINVSPAEYISNKPKIVNVKQMEILDADEIKKLFEIVDPYWVPLFTCWLATGMRRAEIFGLDPSCVDVPNARIHVRQQLTEKGTIVPCTKNKKARTIEVAPEIIDIVVNHMRTAPHLEGEPLVVFPSKTGKAIHFSDWHRDVFKPLVTALGHPKMGTHDLRHTFASHALSQGTNIKAVQEMLGHADAALTLNRYSHLVPSDGRAAASRMANFLLREENQPLYCPSPEAGSHAEKVA